MAWGIRCAIACTRPISSPLLDRQIAQPDAPHQAGLQNVFPAAAAAARSLRQLSDWCADRFGPHEVAARPEMRPL